MRLFVIFLILVGSVCNANAQDISRFNKSGQIVYTQLHNGKPDPEGARLILTYENGIARLVVDQSGKQLIPEVPTEATYLDYIAKKTIQTAVFQDGKQIYTSGDFDPLDGFKPEGPSEKILGYNCQKYVGSSFSNRIELWVTTEAGLLGSPMLRFPFANGLVLKYVRNESSGFEASQVLFSKKAGKTSLLPGLLGQEVTSAEYPQKVARAYIKEVRVFDNQIINWEGKTENPDDERFDFVYRYAGGTVVLKKVKLPDVPDGTSLFVELKQQSNGDAYDRTGSVFVVPVDQKQSFLDGLKFGLAALPAYKSKQGIAYQGVVATPEYAPVIELVRFFTPFGIHYFNDKRNVGIQWEDTTVYKQEITELLPLLRKEAWIGVFIGNYDRGGHKVSLKLDYHLNRQELSDKPAKKYWIQPVFTTTNIMEMAGQEYATMFDSDTLTVAFDVPKGVKNVTFRYLSTGHGGWDNGDEFVQKTNEIFIDSKPFFNYTPWRTDCATYRAFNPASGNFWNGLSSSDYSRSGWCPGTVSNPLYMPVGVLTEGLHTIQVYIPLGKREGNMFSAWNISGVFIGEIE